ncbi:hypothetical protein HDU79_007085 [Rhizoclosmatium sp. JEL0117]|nr:hypothetical protein HDU79_007085 [Rhizoclosmatium sp. JEL0117]
MTAILSSDQVVLVTCKVCSKPVLHSSLLAHLDNCRRINPTAELFQTDDVSITGIGADGKKIGKRKREDGVKKESKKKEKKEDGVPGPAGALPLPGAGGDLIPPLPLSTAPGVQVTADGKPLKLPRTDSVAGGGVTKEKAPKAPKERGPVDFDKHCGVMMENGQYCIRSITCKNHSVAMKRAVIRSTTYENILAEYQGKSRAAAAAGVGGAVGVGVGLEQKMSTEGLVPSHLLTEEDAAKIFDVFRWHQPQPIVKPSSITLAGLISSIGARNVGGMLREIREKRLGGAPVAVGGVNLEGFGAVTPVADGGPSFL